VIIVILISSMYGSRYNVVTVFVSICLMLATETRTFMADNRGLKRGQKKPKTGKMCGGLLKFSPYNLSESLIKRRDGARSEMIRGNRSC
jgi:hypothetical protein